MRVAIGGFQKTIDLLLGIALFRLDAGTDAKRVITELVDQSGGADGVRKITTWEDDGASLTGEYWANCDTLSAVAFQYPNRPCWLLFTHQVGD